jgi:hypothetical protein
VEQRPEYKCTDCGAAIANRGELCRCFVPGATAVRDRTHVPAGTVPAADAGVLATDAGSGSARWTGGTIHLGQLKNMTDKHDGELEKHPPL